MAFSFSDLAGSGSIAVMGIINLSPDSFYSRSSLSSTSEVFRTAEKMIDEGAQEVSQLSLSWSVFCLS